MVFVPHWALALDFSVDRKATDQECRTAFELGEVSVTFHESRVQYWNLVCMLVIFNILFLFQSRRYDSRTTIFSPEGNIIVCYMYLLFEFKKQK